MKLSRSFGLAMVLTICTADVMVKGTKFLHGKISKFSNSFNLTRMNCSQEILIYSLKVTNLARRLGSCINSKYWAKDATDSPGILNNETVRSFSLGHVSLNCGRNISGYNFVWHASVKVSTLTTGQPPFSKIIFTIRCRDSSGSNIRHDVAYHIKKAESNKTLPTQKPATTEAESNQTLPTQKPATTEAESNKTLLLQKPATTAGTTVTDLPLSSTLAPPPPSIKPVLHDVVTPTNSTVTPSLKPDPDAGTPTNYSTVTPSLKPDPTAGKLEVGLIVGLVVGILVAVALIAALFPYLYIKRSRRRQALNNSCNPSHDNTSNGRAEETAM